MDRCIQFAAVHFPSIHKNSANNGKALHGRYRFHNSRTHPFPVIQIPLIHAPQQHLGGGNVGGDGDTVHIAQTQQVLFGDAGRVCLERIPEEKHQIHLIAGDPGSDLLDTAQTTREIAMHGQTGGLRQQPSGGTGGNDSVFGQNGTVSSTELQRKFFAGIVCKNGNGNNALSFVLNIVLWEADKNENSK